MAEPAFDDSVRCVRLLFVANHPRNSNRVRATRNTIDNKIEFLRFEIGTAVDGCWHMHLHHSGALWNCDCRHSGQR